MTLGAALGAALSAGVLFAFSSFVMRALNRLPAPQAITAMQSINREAPTPLFMVPLLGTALVCVGLLVVGLRRLGQPSSICLVIGSALYLAAIVLTAVYHVPRNDALALVDPSAANAGEVWARYFSGWTAWNHVRTLSALAGAITLAVATVVD